MTINQITPPIDTDNDSNEHSDNEESPLQDLMKLFQSTDVVVEELIRLWNYKFTKDKTEMSDEDLLFSMIQVRAHEFLSPIINHAVLGEEIPNDVMVKMCYLTFRHMTEYVDEPIAGCTLLRVELYKLFFTVDSISDEMSELMVNLLAFIVLHSDKVDHSDNCNFCLLGPFLRRLYWAEIDEEIETDEIKQLYQKADELAQKTDYSLDTWLNFVRYMNFMTEIFQAHRNYKVVLNVDEPDPIVTLCIIGLASNNHLIKLSGEEEQRCDLCAENVQSSESHLCHSLIFCQTCIDQNSIERKVDE